MRAQPARAEAEVALVVGRMKPTMVALNVLPVSNSEAPATRRPISVNVRLETPQIARTPRTMPSWL